MSDHSCLFLYPLTQFTSIKTLIDLNTCCNYNQLAAHLSFEKRYTANKKSKPLTRGGRRCWLWTRLFYNWSYHLNEFIESSRRKDVTIGTSNLPQLHSVYTFTNAQRIHCNSFVFHALRGFVQWCISASRCLCTIGNYNSNLLRLYK